MDGLSSYTMALTWPIAQIPLSSLPLTPALPKVCRLLVRLQIQLPGVPVTLFQEPSPQPKASRSRGRFEPRRKGPARGASLVSTAISPLTHWEQKQMSTLPTSQSGFLRKLQQLQRSLSLPKFLCVERRKKPAWSGAPG